MTSLPMSDEDEQGRLGAVVFTDTVGGSALTGRNETWALVLQRRIASPAPLRCDTGGGE